MSNFEQVNRKKNDMYALLLVARKENKPFQIRRKYTPVPTDVMYRNCDKQVVKRRESALFDV